MRTSRLRRLAVTCRRSFTLIIVVVALTGRGCPVWAAEPVVSGTVVDQSGQPLRHAIRAGVRVGF